MVTTQHRPETSLHHLKICLRASDTINPIPTNSGHRNKWKPRSVGAQEIFSIPRKHSLSASSTLLLHRRWTTRRGWRLEAADRMCDDCCDELWMCSWYLTGDGEPWHRLGPSLIFLQDRPQPHHQCSCFYRVCNVMWRCGMVSVSIVLSTILCDVFTITKLLLVGLIVLSQFTFKTFSL